MAATKEEFLKANANDYGYGGLIDHLREEEFPHLKGMTYLDFTGSGLFQQSQLRDAHDEISRELFSNSHSGNPSSKRTDRAIQEARALVLKFFRASADEYEVVFTSGATAGLKIVGESFPWGADSKYVYSVINHTSVLGVRRYCETHGGQFMGLAPFEIDAEINADEPDAGPEAAQPAEGALPCHLFAYPAESNFDGTMFPLSWIDHVNSGAFARHWPGRWFTLLDAAAFVPTQRLDLSKHKPHFVPISFYKIFGYPTGVGALLIRKDVGSLLRKPFFGGGTVTSIMVSTDHGFESLVDTLHETLEAGTLPFLSIVALKHGIKRLETLGMDNVSKHTHSLTRHMFKRMSALRHSNGSKMVEIYGQHSLVGATRQGPIVAFNVVDPSGIYIGYATVSRTAYAAGFGLRSGSLCNPGAAHQLFRIDNGDIMALTAEGKRCGDGVDMFHNKPIGVVRTSIGYPTTFEDVERFVSFLEETFKDKTSDEAKANAPAPK